MRGIEREEFLRLLGETAQPDLPGQPDLPPEPLPTEPTSFWHAGEIPADLSGPAAEIPAGAALAKRLGNFPFWRGTQELQAFLESAYVSAAEKAADLMARR